MNNVNVEAAGSIRSAAGSGDTSKSGSAQIARFTQRETPDWDREFRVEC